MKIIISGNPIDGMTYYGPFADDEIYLAIDDMMDRSEIEGDWWVASLVPALSKKKKYYVNATVLVESEDEFEARHALNNVVLDGEFQTEKQVIGSITVNSVEEYDGH